MKLYLLTRKEEEDKDSFNTYDSLIVCAENEQDAKTIAPLPEFTLKENLEENFIRFDETKIDQKWNNWAWKFSDIYVKEIGEANKDIRKGIILASYNAG